jgi:hypothetical protein
VETISFHFRGRRAIMCRRESGFESLRVGFLLPTARSGARIARTETRRTGATMKNTNDNPVAGYIEAQMTGTAGIVQAAMQGMQRVQEIMLRAMREGAGEQMSLARSLTEARDPADMSRVGSAHSGPAAEQFARYQQELISAVTDMNTQMIQASYSMMERVGGALASSSAAMGMPAGGQGANAMAAYEAGVRQWRTAIESLTQAGMAGMGQGAQGGYEPAGADEEDEDEEEAVEQEEARRPRKPAKRPGRR